MKENNLILLNNERLSNTQKLRRAFWRWALNLFHVHEFQDERVVPRTDPDGTLMGDITIQKCYCGERRSQTMGFYGFERR
jgi:hypothetical protein